MSETSELLLVKLLIKEGIVSESDFNAVMADKPVHEISIRSYILKKMLVTEREILEVLSKDQHIPIADLGSYTPEPRLLNIVSVINATSFLIFPLKEDNGQLILGMVDVLDSNIFDDLRFCLSMPFSIELISMESHEYLVSRYYTEISNDDSSLGVLYTEQVDLDDSSVDDPAINDAPVIVLLNNILIQAINEHASDIHFEPFENEFKIRYRIDGVLYEMIPPPRHLALSVLSRIKVMAKMNIAEKRVPQDGRISLKINEKKIDLRVSTIPTAFGESAVLRILDRSHISLDLDKLGLTREMTKKIKKIIHKPNGIFIATGPTGAGKTTTLYSCLREINTIDTKIITTEDPVEYDIAGITQVAINEGIGLSFSICLRSILRQDPDNIMVGEIRDLKTMNMAIQASLTGHLVLTTLHTNDAASAITRLIDMGVEPFLICSSLEAIIAQRLIRTLCNDCKEAFMPSESMLKLLSLNLEDMGSTKFYKAVGCGTCNGIGYKGRNGIYELLVLDDEIRDLIMQRATANMIREVAIKNGMKTLMDDGLKKIQSGQTSIEEVSLWIAENQE